MTEDEIARVLALIERYLSEVPEYRSLRRCALIAAVLKHESEETRERVARRVLSLELEIDAVRERKAKNGD